MRRIIFFSYTMRMGGAERALLDLVNNLVDNTCEIILISLTDGELAKLLDPRIYYVPILKRDESKIFKFKYALFMRLVAYFPTLINFIIKHFFVRIKSKDVVVSFLEGPTTKLVSYLKNKKIAWMHTDYIANHWTDTFFRSKEVEAKVYNNFDKIVFVSENGQRSFKKYFKEFPISSTQTVIHNPIDIKKIREQSKKAISFPFNNGLKTIITVGRIVPVKNIKLLVNAISRIQYNDIDCNLLIIGDGSDLEILKQYAQKKEIKNICFAGFQENPYPYMKASDIYVSTSKAESYPLNIAEAIVLHKAVIATKNSGSIEILNNGEYGILIDQNVNELILKLSRLLSSDIEYHRAVNNSKKIAQQFEVTNNYDQIQSLIFEEL
ncbi:glycosyltransferase [Lactiplantibacillus plantarum]